MGQEKRVVRVGLVGGGFMGKAHSNAWRQVGHFFDLPLQVVMRGICDIKPEVAQSAAQKYGWQGWSTDYKRFVQRPDLDVIDVCTDNNTHAPVALAAIKAGKNVICEKPLALDLAQAKKMLAAARRAKVTHMLSQNYRTAPAVAFAKELIQKGAIGRIFHWRACYLQDWIVDPNFPLVWRLIKSKAGSGAHGDLNEHLIDMSRFLVGDIVSVCGLMKTFITERPLPTADAGRLSVATAGRKRGRVTVDDATLFLAEFSNGAVGSFEATRFAPGRKNHHVWEINGSKGSLRWNLERMNELEYFDRTAPVQTQGFTTILATDASHPYFGAWWPAGHIIGYEHTFTHTILNFLTALAEKKTASPSFADGVASQAVLEAVEKSAKSGRWTKVTV
jgi:predicted dehydrogenase